MSENVETKVYVPANLIDVQIDALAKEAFEKWYTGYIAGAGAKIAALAEAKIAAGLEIEKLNKQVETVNVEFDKAAKKLAQEKNWAGIAKSEADRASKLAEIAKAKAKQESILNGTKAPSGEKRGSGELEVAKLDWAGIRDSVHYFHLGGKAFVVTHSSKTKGQKTESDVFYAVACQPVSVKANELGLAFTESIPTITGDANKPIRLEVAPGKQAVLSHSGFANGIKKAMVEKALVVISAGTAYQPNKIDARITESEYDFVVTKE